MATARQRRIHLPVPGVAVLTMGSKTWVFRYRLGHTPKPAATIGAPLGKISSLTGAPITRIEQ